MQGHIGDLAEDKIVMGDSLEAALEQGEKHEAFATKCMEVSQYTASPPFLSLCPPPPPPPPSLSFPSLSYRTYHLTDTDDRGSDEQDQDRRSDPL